jgi:hypothetical protein
MKLALSKGPNKVVVSLPSPADGNRSQNGVFWDVTPCGFCKNRRFGELSASIMRVTRIGEQETLVVTSNRRKLRRNTKVLIASYG